MDDLTEWYENGATTEQAFQNVCDTEGVNDVGQVKGAKKKKSPMDKMVENFKPEAAEYNGDNETGYSVLVKDKNSDFEAWVDIWVDERNHDINKDWNQYIFDTTNNMDVDKEEIQNNDAIYDMTTSEAVNFLEEKGILKNEDAGWSYGGKVKGSKERWKLFSC